MGRALGQFRRGRSRLLHCWVQREACISLGIAANRLTFGVLSMTFISLANAISMSRCFFLYAGTAVAAWVFVYVRLPETKGRTLDGMESLQSDRSHRLPA
ncbi:hypothetical protein PR202_ga22569 [Eleusine coracana subsp. coracana]|uniref:Uncharacterized protein n=1 Tax=Eleusine coracana subsp. coracana TaxID=191504 RepID=A0AAV5D3P3_ELECO|nr:hypothetical protein PR202_ga22569 [Eleusine coracana subsp. coracana]